VFELDGATQSPQLPAVRVELEFSEANRHRMATLVLIDQEPVQRIVLEEGRRSIAQAWQLKRYLNVEAEVAGLDRLNQKFRSSALTLRTKETTLESFPGPTLFQLRCSMARMVRLRAGSRYVSQP
jgi:hypothetical protein